MVVGCGTLDYNKSGLCPMDQIVHHHTRSCGFHGRLPLVPAYSQFSQLEIYKSEFLNSPEPQNSQRPEPDTEIPNTYTKDQWERA